MSSNRTRCAPLVAVGLALSVSACAGQLREVGREPAMTPVGSGLVPDRTVHLGLPITEAAYHSGNSTWRDSGADLFRDARAFRIGDVVTVKVRREGKYIELPVTLGKQSELDAKR